MSRRPGIAIVGVGAIGSVLAVRLQAAGHRVAVVARGRTAEAIRAAGLRLEAAGDNASPRTVQPEVASDLAALGPRDMIFLCVKAHDLAAATAGLERSIADGSIIVPVLNGIPWWYGGGAPDARLRSIDPDGVLAQRFGAAAIVGCVVHMAAQMRSPGVVGLTADGAVMVGDAGGGTRHAAEVAGVLAAAGFNARATDDIRHEIWIKLAGNAAFNPVSALTGATVGEICARDDLLAVVRAAMQECMSVGMRHGIVFPVSIEQRIAMARVIGGAKLSMLQDIEAGRAVETDALLGAVIELGDRVDLPTPTLTMLHALVSHRARHPLTGREPN